VRSESRVFGDALLKPQGTQVVFDFQYDGHRAWLRRGAPAVRTVVAKSCASEVDASLNSRIMTSTQR